MTKWDGRIVHGPASVDRKHASAEKQAFSGAHWPSPENHRITILKQTTDDGIRHKTTSLWAFDPCSSAWLMVGITCWRTRTAQEFTTASSLSVTMRGNCRGLRRCAVAGGSVWWKASLLNSQLGSCLPPGGAASDGLLDVGRLSATACLCHVTLREIPEDAKPLFRTTVSPHPHPGPHLPRVCWAASVRKMFCLLPDPRIKLSSSSHIWDDLTSIPSPASETKQELSKRCLQSPNLPGPVLAAIVLFSLPGIPPPTLYPFYLVIS